MQKTASRPANWVSANQVPELMALLSGQTFNPTGIDTQLPQMPQTPPMGEVQLPQVPPFGGQPQQPTQPTTYGQNTPNQPYAPPQYGPSTNQPNQMMPKNWLTESIVATVVTTLCCGAWFITLITGIIAIVNANGVKNKFNSGDYAGANKKAASARLWCLITVPCCAREIIQILNKNFCLISRPQGGNVLCHDGPCWWALRELTTSHTPVKMRAAATACIHCGMASPIAILATTATKGCT